MKNAALEIEKGITTNGKPFVKFQYNGTDYTVIALSAYRVEVWTKRIGLKMQFGIKLYTNAEFCQKYHKINPQSIISMIAGSHRTDNAPA